MYLLFFQGGWRIFPIFWYENQHGLSWYFKFIVSKFWEDFVYLIPIKTLRTY